MSTYTAREVALEHFSRGCNCAESVLAGVSKAYNLDPEVTPKVATAFGGGMALHGEVCGAVTGALMALGLSQGANTCEDEETRQAMYKKASELMDSFEKEFDTVMCRELLGFQLNEPGGMERAKEMDLHGSFCRKFVGFAAEKTAEMIEQYQSAESRSSM